MQDTHIGTASFDDKLRCKVQKSKNSQGRQQRQAKESQGEKKEKYKHEDKPKIMENNAGT